MTTQQSTYFGDLNGEYQSTSDDPSLSGLATAYNK